jgi:hypothetical protein
MKLKYIYLYLIEPTQRGQNSQVDRVDIAWYITGPSPLSSFLLLSSSSFLSSSLLFPPFYTLPLYPLVSPFIYPLPPSTYTGALPPSTVPSRFFPYPSCCRLSACWLLSLLIASSQTSQPYWTVGSGGFTRVPPVLVQVSGVSGTLHRRKGHTARQTPNASAYCSTTSVFIAKLDPHW